MAPVAQGSTGDAHSLRTVRRAAGPPRANGHRDDRICVVLFIAYGEDKDLLPYRFNGLYQRRSLKAKAKDLLELEISGEGFGEGDTWWEEVKAIFNAVNIGNPSWGVPAYDGGLFSLDAEESAIGAALEEVSLPDTVFGPALQHLLLVPTKEGGLGPVDFRSLGVREFGTVYAGKSTR